MSNEFEFHAPLEVEEPVADDSTSSEDRSEDRSEERRVFVPREPDPASWPVSEVKFSVTRGEELFIQILAGFLAVILIVATIFFAATADGWTSPAAVDTPKEEHTTPATDAEAPDISTGAFADGAEGNVLYGDASAIKTVELSGTSATHTALAKVSDGKLVASKGADQKVYPASITKVMTLIVVVEHLRSDASLQEVITISEDIVAAMKKEGSSGIGLAAGEQLTVESLLYALMLKSDGVAACQLARYVAGTEEAFVALMNQKAQTMGLTGTHFMNPTGLHHENHYSTCRDLATVMGYAMNMSLCRKIMTEDAFDASCTQANGNTFEYHIYNNLLTTYFNDYKNLNPAKAGNLTVIAGKTGYTPESKYCLATCAQAPDGSYYVCVTVGADSYESNIKAYQTIYVDYAD